MPIDDILVHTATPRRMVESGVKQQGTRDVEPVRLEPFACCLFLPLGSEATGGSRSRQVSSPTLLYTIFDTAGQPVQLGPNDEVYVSAPELSVWAGGDEVLWKVDGEPQPAGKPGEDPVVVQARLTKVAD